MSSQLKELVEEAEPIPHSANPVNDLKPLFSHKHATEGFALDWSNVAEGHLASGTVLYCIPWTTLASEC